MKSLAIKTVMVKILVSANQFTQVLSTSLLFHLDFLLYINAQSANFFSAKHVSGTNSSNFLLYGIYFIICNALKQADMRDTLYYDTNHSPYTHVRKYEVRSSTYIRSSTYERSK